MAAARVRGQNGHGPEWASSLITRQSVWGGVFFGGGGACFRWHTMLERTVGPVNDERQRSWLRTSRQHSPYTRHVGLFGHFRFSGIAGPECVWRVGRHGRNHHAEVSRSNHGDQQGVGKGRCYPGQQSNRQDCGNPFPGPRQQASRLSTKNDFRDRGARTSRRVPIGGVRLRP